MFLDLIFFGPKIIGLKSFFTKKNVLTKILGEKFFQAFYKMFLIFIWEVKIDFKTGKNDLNRKWNYFTNFQASDLKNLSY